MTDLKIKFATPLGSDKPSGTAVMSNCCSLVLVTVAKNLPNSLVVPPSGSIAVSGTPIKLILVLANGLLLASLGITTKFILASPLAN